MGFFNLGSKDEYGKQRRIEHRGRHLRASRTGGVALRVRAEAAGMTVTANTSTGFRASATPMENTQVALQNGRFVLRGRYGDGPTKLNVSKTGATVSTRNALGSFNWIKPNRSSAKVAGVQLRGKNAAFLQMVYMLFVGIAAALQFAVLALVWLLEALVSIGDILYRLALATPYALAVMKRRIRNARLERRLSDAGALFDPPVDEWTPDELTAALALVLSGWGRGKSASVTAGHLASGMDAAAKDGLVNQAADALGPIAERLETARERPSDGDLADPRTLMALLARQLARVLDPSDTAEAVLAVDEWALDQGARTVLEEQLLEVCADFTGLRFRTPEPDPPAEPDGATDTPAAVDEGLVDLNTATLEELQAVPHLGAQRARALVAMRPIREVNELTAIDGIGPKRVEDICAHGMVCS